MHIALKCHKPPNNNKPKGGSNLEPLESPPLESLLFVVRLFASFSSTYFFCLFSIPFYRYLMNSVLSFRTRKTPKEKKLYPSFTVLHAIGLCIQIFEIYYNTIG